MHRSQRSVTDRRMHQGPNRIISEILEDEQWGCHSWLEWTREKTGRNDVKDWAEGLWT